VVSAVDAESIYEVPLVLHAEGLDGYLAGLLRLPDTEPDLSEWESLVDRIHRASRPLEISIVGKYVNLRDAYLSVMEAIKHAAFHHGARANLTWIASDELVSGGAEELLRKADGILVPGGFGIRGVEGKVEAIRYAREGRVPFLGLCLGLQCAVIEFARNVCGLDGANSSEFEAVTPHPVIDLLPEQHGVVDMGATMRLGAYPCELVSGTRAAEAYGTSVVHERHRHRYEVNPRYHRALQEGGMVFSGMSPDRRLVEIIELPDHPCFLAGQFHPELKSRPTRPHPLFSEFVGAALNRRPAGVPEPAAVTS
jgi:CTP synthase